MFTVVWRRRGQPGAGPFAVMMLAAGWWSAGALLEHASTTPAVKIAWAALEYPGIMAAAPLWLLFAVDYAGRGAVLRGRRAVALAVIPLLTVALVWTNAWHHLVWTTITPSSPQPGAALVYGHGPGFWAAAAYNYALLVVGTGVLIATLARAHARYHGQTAALLIGLALPWVGNALYLSGVPIFGHVDPTPLAFALTGVVFGAGLFRRRLFDLVPVARHALIESMADGVLVLDAQDRVIDVNPSARALLGLAAAPIGEPAPQVLARWPALAAIIAAGTATEADAHVETPRGVRDIHARAGLLFDDRGRERGRLLVLGDVTDRKRTEETLRQTEKLASLGQLLAGVAHELNNPLSVVIGHATLLKRDVSGAAAVRVDKIATAADRCARIIANFLAVARREPERGDTDVNRVLRDAAALLSHPLTVDDVAVVLQLAPALPPIHADAQQLHQVAVNLISNAHQAMLHAARRVVTLHSRHDGAAHRVVFSVTDTGPGIAPAVRHRVFEPFFTTKPVGTGSGLGLSVCRGIVEAHGGTIEVLEAPGGGARIEIALPLAAGAPPAAAADSQAAAEVIRGTRVLVVDDEPLVAGLLAEMLEQDGHLVDVVQHGRAALERIAVKGFDVIISDFRMPVLDGAGLYEGLARHDARLRGRLVFISGDTLTPETRRFIESTGAPTLDKPFDAVQVRRIVQTVLRRE